MERAGTRAGNFEPSGVGIALNGEVERESGVSGSKPGNPHGLPRRRIRSPDQADCHFSVRVATEHDAPGVGFG
jgi:hypothetical protein